MKKEKKVSVILPVYNSEKNIKRCMNSIINQTYENIEIIIINDGSTDKTERIIKEYKKNINHIKYIYKENSGPGDTRNIGLANATGDYIMFVDSDDYIEPNMIEKMLGCLEREKVDIVRCNYKIVKSDDIQINFKFNHNSKTILKEDLIENYVLKSILWNTVWGQIIKRECISDLKFDSKKKIGEDLLFNVELYNKITKIYFLNEFLYYYKYNENGITKKLNFDNLKKNRNDVIEMYMCLFNKFSHRNNKQEIIDRCMQAVISYQLQLTYVKFKEIKKLKSVLTKNKMLIRFLKSYSRKKIQNFIVVRKERFLFFLV